MNVDLIQVAKSKELILIAEGIHSVSSLRFQNLEDENYVTLSLHGNKISNLFGFQIHQFHNLVELNLSSNEIQNCDLPELASLTRLESLDLSANYISTTSNFPFIPSLKVLSLGFNQIVSLDELGFSVPSLQILDVRGNLISDASYMSSLFKHLNLRP